MTGPFAAWLTYAAALWLWHTPALFQAALEGGWRRGAQQLSLFVSAFAFCDVLVRAQERQGGYRATVTCLVAACAHTTLLGALLADASAPWYPSYEATTVAWGRTPLEDQQLGGLIMGVGAGVVFSIAGLVLLITWLRDTARRVPAEEKAILLDTDLWISREWIMTRRDHVGGSR
jgi:cytochrome c oxidase assembly factor CtaG